MQSVELMNTHYLLTSWHRKAVLISHCQRFITFFISINKEGESVAVNDHFDGQ